MLESDARDDIIIETLDADYEDVESLNNLDVINTMRCNKHVKNCALQNVLKILVNMYKNGAPSEIIVLDIYCQGHLPEQQSESFSRRSLFIKKL